jgi:hypothetical protein
VAVFDHAYYAALHRHPDVGRQGHHVVHHDEALQAHQQQIRALGMKMDENGQKNSYPIFTFIFFSRTETATVSD